ncbi:MAG: hypothetical protein IKS17_04305 [Firmicutes bacterium]|nr:hypothetical protein [Bacillota bacterium]
MNLTFGDVEETALIPLAIKASETRRENPRIVDEMKKYSLRGKLFAIIGKNLNNRLAVFKW